MQLSTKMAPYIVKIAVQLQILQSQNKKVLTNIYENAPEHEEADRVQVNIFLSKSRNT